jgi:putative peptidoglycan lipid II flippase
VFEIIMPPFVALISGYHGEKLALATFLTRITFPYLILISLVSLFSGILNSSRGSPPRPSRRRCSTWRCCRADLRPRRRRDHRDRAGDRGHDRRRAPARPADGRLRAPGSSLKLRRPRMTPGVRQFVRVVIPATLGAGVYQISAFIDTFFLTRIGTGSMSYFNYADRLNQLPLGVIGAALGTAILPQVSRHVGAGEPDKAARVQGQAAELAMLLCLPPRSRSRSRRAADLALVPGRRFTAEDARSPR